MLCAARAAHTGSAPTSSAATCFSRVLVAVQASLRVAVVSVAFAVVVGVTIGVVAGYRGGWVDTVVMRVVDVMFAFPVLLLALAIVAVLGPA